MTREAILTVKDLSVDFPTRAGTAKVIDHLNFELKQGEVLGIVGESGCGKSMTALSVMGLLPAGLGNVVSGQILLRDRDLIALQPDQMCKVRGHDIGMVFQEPMTALNPVFTVGNQIAEAFRAHRKVDWKEAWERAVEMLHSVGVPSPEQRVYAYPHQLSGGLRQRVMIAMALVCEPSVLICDEPTTALDVTIQAQVLDLLRDLRDRRGMSMLFITHDMGVIAEMADRVLVMYAGRKIEEGLTEDIIRKPAHPYTRGLIDCIPAVKINYDGIFEPLQEIPGVVPALTRLGAGCAFEPRCNKRFAACMQSIPNMTDLGNQQAVACWSEMEKLRA